MYSVHLVHFCPIQFSLVLFGSTQSTSVHSVHFGLIRSPLVLFGPVRSNSVHSVHYFPILSYSVLVNPIRSILSTFVLYGLFSLSQPTSIIFSPLQSTSDLSIYFGPFGSIWSNQGHFSPILHIPCTRKFSEAMRTCNWARMEFMYFSQQLNININLRYSTPEALNFPLFNENAYVLGSYEFFPGFSKVVMPFLDFQILIT